MSVDFIGSNVFVYLFDDTDAIAFFDTILAPMWRVYPSAELYRRAVEIKVRYQLSFSDSLIVGAALEAGCSRLLTEDLQDGQSFGSLRVVNPFGPDGDV